MSPSLQNNNRSSSYHNIYGLDDYSPQIHLNRDERDRRRSEYSSRTLPLLHKHKKEENGQQRQRSLSPPSRLYQEENGRRENGVSNGSAPPFRGVCDSIIYTPPPGVLQRAPSQVTMHYTTVPQSMISRELGSRHHPTRSSLRRSRLLVLVRNGTVPRKYLPGVVEKEKLGVFLSLLQLLLGAVATILAIWRVVQSNNISKAEDWPYYSGLMVMLSGWFGLILLVNCRYLYPGVSHHPCIFPIRTYHIVGCVVVSTAGGVSALVSSICYLLHLITYSFSNCQEAKTPPGWPVNACVCLSSTLIWSNGELVYPATSCNQVLSEQSAFLSILLTVNLLAVLASLGFLLLLTSSKQVRQFKEWRNTTKKQRKQYKAVTNQLPKLI